jgi:hypothetical protein
MVTKPERVAQASTMLLGFRHRAPECVECFDHLHVVT